MVDVIGSLLVVEMNFDRTFNGFQEISNLGFFFPFI